MTKRYDVVIVGAGIAGLTAGIYARRANKTVLVIEEKVIGGQIISTYKIENYPGLAGISGADLMTKISHQANNLGVEIEYDVVQGVEKKGEEFLVKAEDEEYTAGAVIIATGGEELKLGLDREEKLAGRGVSYCATCDGALYKGKKVAVIGGGNTALYDALYLADLAETVYLVHRRGEFRGDAVLVERLKKKENVEMVLEKVPTEILGEKKVTGLRVKEAQGTEEKELEVEGIFVAIGRKPGTEKFRGLVEMDEKGYILAGETCETSCPGIYAAGDCRKKEVKQLVTAAADGAVAATKMAQR